MLSATAAVMLGAGPAFADPAIPYRELPTLPDLEEEADAVADVSLASAQEVDDDRVVGAAKREQSLGTVASAVTVVTLDQIRRFGYRTLAEVIAAVSGVYLTDDRAIERVGIRGVQILGDANTRILVLIDGTPLNEPWSQYVDASYALPVNLDDVARIEVIRGPVSSIYGTNAFLGIVNIVTRAADVAAPAYGSLTGDTFTGFGGSAGFAVGGVDRQARGAVSFRRRGAEQLTYDELGATSADQLDALNGGLTVIYDRLFFQVRAYQRERELPGAPFNSMVGSTGNTSRDQQAIGELGYTRELSSVISLAARLYASAYDQHAELVYPADPSTSAILTSNGRSRWLGGELRGLIDLSSWMPRDGKLDVTTGVAVETTSTSSDSALGAAGDRMPGPIIEQDFSILGAYGELIAAPVPWAALTAGLRFDRHSLFESKLNPRLALVLYDRERYGLKLLYAAGFRNPSIFEAFYQDQRFLPACSPTCQTDGTTLFPETISSYEAVLWARPVRGLKLRLSGWQWDLRSLIERRAIFDPGTFTEKLQYQNLAALRSRGLELEASYRNSAGWFGYGNAGFADVKRNVIATPANSPELTASVGISTPAIAGVVHVSTEMVFVGERQTRDDEVTADAWLGWNLALYLPDLRGFDLTIAARNLLGTRQQVVAQDDYDRQGDVDLGIPPTDVLIIPGAGREVFTRLGYRF